MSLDDLLNRLAGAARGVATDSSGDERRRRARKAYYTEQARAELRDDARRARERYRQSTAGAGREESGPHREQSGPHREQARPHNEEARSSGDGNRSTREKPRSFQYRGRAVADYYEVLEVSPKARQSVIDKAYRTLMREHHPDQGGDQRTAQLINEAYEVLSDPERRRQYDRENGLL